MEEGREMKLFKFDTILKINLFKRALLGFLKSTYYCPPEGTWQKVRPHG